MDPFAVLCFKTHIQIINFREKPSTFEGHIMRKQKLENSTIIGQINEKSGREGQCDFEASIAALSFLHTPA